MHTIYDCIIIIIIIVNRCECVMLTNIIMLFIINRSANAAIGLVDSS